MCCEQEICLTAIYNIKMGLDLFTGLNLGGMNTDFQGG